MSKARFNNLADLLNNVNIPVGEIVEAVALADTNSQRITDHENANDPHTQYYNQTRGDDRYVRVATLAQPNGVATLNDKGKIVFNQLPDAALGGLDYQGSWNADTNTPILFSSQGVRGYFYKVNVAGNTELNGITDWKIGDWAIYNGDGWQKIDQTEVIQTVNSQTGAVVLGTDDVDEGTANLYYTDQRASDAAPIQTIHGRTGTVVATDGDYDAGKVVFDPVTSDLTSNRVQNVVEEVNTKLNNHMDNTTGDPYPQYTTPTEASNAAPVQTVNSYTGTVVLDTDDVDEGTTNLYYTNARADARFNQFGLGTSQPELITNLNTAFTTGVYRYEATATGNPDSQISGVLFVTAYGNGSAIRQMAFPATSSANEDAVFVRQIYGITNIVGSWVELWHTGNMGVNSGLDADLLDGEHGTHYLDWTNTTNKPDPTITVTGDASGSVILTNLGDGLLSLSVNDDSHNHLISNVDGLQSALDGKIDSVNGYENTVVLVTDDISEDAAPINLWYTDTRARNAIGVSGDLSYDALNGVISFDETYSTPTELLTAIKTVDGSTSGLDADLLDGQNGTYYLNYNNFTNRPTYDNYVGWILNTDGTSRGSITSGETVRFNGGVNVTLTYSATDNAITIDAVDTTYSAGTGLNLTGTTFSLSDERYTAIEKNKLAAIESGADVNVVDSVNTQTGAVVLGTDDVSEGSTNLYYTNARATTAIKNDPDWNNANWDSAYGWGDHGLAGYELQDNKGKVNGYAGLGGDGKVPSAQLPSFVDDVVEYSSETAFPATGETGKMYVALDTNKVYRWSGSAYVYITSGAVDSVNSKTGVVELSTNDIDEGTNLYHTTTRARSAVSATGDLAYNATTGVFSFSESYSTPAELLTAIKTVDGSTSGLDADLLDGNNSSYFTNASNLATGTVHINRLPASALVGDTNYYLNGLSFASTTGVLTATVNGATNQTVDLDGRYSLDGHTHNYDNYGGWALQTNGTARGSVTSGEVVNFAAGSNVSLSYSTTNNTITINSTDTNTDTNTTYSAGGGLTLSGTTFSLTGDSFDSSGNYTGLRAQNTTKTDVGLSGIPNTNSSTVNYLRGDGTWVTPPDTNTDTNYYLNGLSFATSTGVLTATVNGTTNQTVDLDGRYSLSGHTHSYDNYGSWTLLTDGVSRGGITSGENVNFIGGSNVSLSYSTTNNAITISSTDTNTNTTYSAGGGLTLTGTSFSLTGDSFDSGGNYTGLRAQNTTKTDVGLSGIPNINSSTANYLRGDGLWVTPPNTNYYLSNLTFATSTGVLTATVNGTTNQAVDLDGRYLLTTSKAADSQKLDGFDSTQYVRSDINDTISGNIEMSGRLSLTGANGPALAVSRGSGKASIEPTAGESYLMLDGPTVGLNWYNAGDVILANGGGEVGIGTPAPVHKLDVNGDVGGNNFYATSYKSEAGTGGCTMQYNDTSKSLEFNFS